MRKFLIYFGFLASVLIGQAVYATDVAIQILEIPVSVLVSPTSVNLNVGQTQQLTATAVFADASTLEITSNSLTNWNSSAPAISSVSLTGAVNGVAQGNASVTAEYGGVTSNAAAITVGGGTTDGGGTSGGGGGGGGGEGGDGGEGPDDPDPDPCLTVDPDDLDPSSYLGFAGNAEVDLSWTSSTSPCLASQKIFVSDDGGTTYFTEYSLATTVDLLKVTGLTNGTTYRFQYIAYGTDGTEGNPFFIDLTPFEIAKLIFEMHPEKRTHPATLMVNAGQTPDRATLDLGPYDSNQDIEFRLELRDPVTKEVDFLVEDIETNDAGFGEIEITAVPVGNYDIFVKTVSHVGDTTFNINVQHPETRVDLSQVYTNLLLAGDVNSTYGDNFVNGIDFSVLANKIYQNDKKTDLNRDLTVNGLDFAMTAANIYLWGDE